MQSRMRTLALNLNAYGGSLQSLVLQKIVEVGHR